MREGASVKQVVSTALALTLLLTATGVGHAEGVGIEVGLPSLSTTDGRFIGLAGTALETLSQPVKVWIGVPSGQRDVDIDLFDGDLGGLWDNHDPNNTSLFTQYVLYPDPLKTGDPKGETPIVSATSRTMADNAWTTLYRGPVHPAARAPSGNYFYLLVAQWSNPAFSNAEFNAFKVRASGQVSLPGAQVWAFVGAPINLPPNVSQPPVDPPLQSAGNTYAGQWDWFVYVPTSASLVSFTDCDADSRLSPSSPGNPPDDDVADPRVRIPPDIRYAIFRPDGQLAINNSAPSGNNVCETKQTGAEAGLYHWVWSGVDAHNFVYGSVDYETLPIDATPLPVGPLGPTPSATGVRITATPTVTASPTKAAPPSGSGSSSSTSAQPTDTPSATLSPTPSRTAPTAISTRKPTASSTPARTASPTPSRTALPTTSTPTRSPSATVVTKLPSTGDGLPIGPLCGVSLLAVIIGRRLRRVG
jgi:hypothetical protein